MLNEKEDVRVILRDMTKSPDGVSCIAACMLAIVMGLMNILMPELFNAVNTTLVGKWLAIWFFSPALSFLIYVRSHQIFDGHGPLWPMVRSMVVLIPVFVLIYFNF